METVRHRVEWLALAAGVVLSVALSRIIPRLGADHLPQRPGDSVLALVLGDARQQLSQRLFDKAEEYFHGGVRDVDCEHGLAQAGCEEEHELAATPVRKAADPWSWLNSQVHVQAHRHTDSDTAVELLPWIWASCRASPKNVPAFLAGSYVLARLAGRPGEGVALLEEGIHHNPQCAELDLTLGELWLHRLKDPARAEACFQSALRKNAAAGAAAGEDAQVQRLRILFCLGYLAKTRGEAERLRAYVREADALNPAQVSARNLHALLESLEKKE